MGIENWGGGGESKSLPTSWNLWHRTSAINTTHITSGISYYQAYDATVIKEKMCPEYRYKPESCYL
jgi:hypothetical protein